MVGARPGGSGFRKFGTGQIITTDPNGGDDLKDEQTETIDRRNIQAGADLEQDESEE